MRVSEFSCVKRHNQFEAPTAVTAALPGDRSRRIAAPISVLVSRMVRGSPCLYHQPLPGVEQCIKFFPRSARPPSARITNRRQHTRSSFCDGRLGRGSGIDAR